jgi:hypothetical protein
MINPNATKLNDTLPGIPKIKSPPGSAGMTDMMATADKLEAMIGTATLNLDATVSLDI